MEKLEEDFDRIYEELGDGNYDVEEEALALEESVRERLEYEIGKEKKQLSILLKKIIKMKKEFDFYDAESELDRMFPDRDEDDFDEDSMSHDSVFGDD